VQGRLGGDTGAGGGLVGVLEVYRFGIGVGDWSWLAGAIGSSRQGSGAALRGGSVASVSMTPPQQGCKPTIAKALDAVCGFGCGCLKETAARLGVRSEAPLSSRDPDIQLAQPALLAGL